MPINCKIWEKYLSNWTRNRAITSTYFFFVLMSLFLKLCKWRSFVCYLNFFISFKQLVASSYLCFSKQQRNIRSLKVSLGELCWNPCNSCIFISQGQKTRGAWSFWKQEWHINILELIAVKLGLLFLQNRGKIIFYRLYFPIDSTTAF